MFRPVNLCKFVCVCMWCVSVCWAITPIDYYLLKTNAARKTKKKETKIRDGNLFFSIQ